MLKYKILAIFLALTIIFSVPMNVNADLATLNLYYYKIQADNTPVFEQKFIIIPARLPTQCRAEIIFYLVFNDTIFMPPNVRLISAKFSPENGLLVINVSREIKAYGGNFFENMLVERILQNARALPEVKFLTLLIEGQLQALPEGSLIYQVSVK